MWKGQIRPDYDRLKLDVTRAGNIVGLLRHTGWR